MSAEPQKQTEDRFWPILGLTGLFFSLLLGGFAVIGVCDFVEGIVQKTREQRAPELIRTVLSSQESAWNAGDLDGFMSYYWKSDELKFLSGDTVTTGWQATHDRYHKRYKADGQKMGKLKFDLLDVDVVNSDAAIVRGKWALTMADGKNPHGLFTLLFRRIDGDWVIVSDHTSAAEK
jgi:ketosteroid isomerase-like protein